MKFLVPNYSCLQNPLTRGLSPPDPPSLCPLSSTEFVETPTPLPNKIPGYATESRNLLTVVKSVSATRHRQSRCVRRNDQVIHEFQFSR